MDILIKSFNRPYYLDRCLASIMTYVVGFDKIIIMDDGTPKVYLEKIKQNYPNVNIVYSENYLIKSTIIASESGQVIPSIIPTKLWNEQAKLASNYFIMLEDDMWFISPTDLTQWSKFLLTNNVQMLKLFWLGNQKLVDYQQKKEFDTLELCQPKKSVFNQFYFYWIYYRLQRLNKVKSFFGLYDKDALLDYYSIYGVAGMIFKKDYYLALWQNNQTRVNEMQQLMNAIKYLKNKVDFPIAKPKDEVIKTGFISAATNSNKEHYNHFIDVTILNNYINQLWLNNELDVLENFPKDFSETFIFEHLKSYAVDFAENWLNWHKEFKQQYIKMGCKI